VGKLSPTEDLEVWWWTKCGGLDYKLAIVLDSLEFTGVDRGDMSLSLLLVFSCFFNHRINSLH
jgi:hypothetical protein